MTPYLNGDLESFVFDTLAAVAPKIHICNKFDDAEPVHFYFSRYARITLERRLGFLKVFYKYDYGDSSVLHCASCTAHKANKHTHIPRIWYCFSIKGPGKGYDGL